MSSSDNKEQEKKLLEGGNLLRRSPRKRIDLHNSIFRENSPNIVGSSFDFIYWDQVEVLQMGGSILIEKRLSQLTKLCDIKDHTNLLIWTIPSQYPEIFQAVEAAGWNIWRDPAIWHISNGKSARQHPAHHPIPNYEIAVIATYKSDPNPYKPGELSVACRAPRNEIFPEKPVRLLQTIFSYTCDTETDMLDFSCRNGSALIAAASMNIHSYTGFADTIEDFDKAAQTANLYRLSENYMENHYGRNDNR